MRGRDGVLWRGKKHDFSIGRETLGAFWNTLPWNLSMGVHLRNPSWPMETWGMEQTSELCSSQRPTPLFPSPPEPGAEAAAPETGQGEEDKQAALDAAVIMAIIRAFIWLPNESHHRQREKLSIAWALMNFFANCNQARPSQLAD